MHRLDLGLDSYPKEFLGKESEPVLTPRKKSPLPEKISSEEDRTHDAASSRTASPTHYQLSYSDPASVQSRRHRDWQTPMQRPVFHLSPFTFHLDFVHPLQDVALSTAGCSPPSMPSTVLCLLLSCFTFHLSFVHPLQDVALHQCLPSSSVCCFSLSPFT